MTKLVRIGPLSLARVFGIIYAGLGLIVGALVTVVAVLGTAIGLAQRGGGSALLGLGVGAGAVILLPLFYGALGFLIGAVAAWLYNLAASKVGGIELDLRPGA